MRGTSVLIIDWYWLNERVCVKCPLVRAVTDTCHLSVIWMLCGLQLDTWAQDAVWCGPLVTELPALKSLKRIPELWIIITSNIPTYKLIVVLCAATRYLHRRAGFCVLCGKCLFKKVFIECFISNIRRNSGVISFWMMSSIDSKLNSHIFQVQIMDPKMITFQMLPDILPSRVHVAIYLRFDSDSSALQHVMVSCWIWQCTTASVCLNNECLLINDDQNSACQHGFNNTGLVLQARSAVKCGRFRSTCMSQHSHQ